MDNNPNVMINSNSQIENNSAIEEIDPEMGNNSEMGNILEGVKDWIVLWTLSNVIICVWAFFDRITGPSWSVGESKIVHRF